MHVIAFPGQKGGTGKSTICLNLAVELAQQDYRVVILDADPQGSLSSWYQAAQAHEEEHPDYKYPTVIGALDNLKKTLESLAPAFDVAMIDLPGRDAKIQRQALMCADTALLVIAPGSFDIWTLEHTLDYVNQAKELRQERDELLGTDNPLQAAFIRNRFVAQQNLSKRVSELLDEVEEPILESAVSARVAFAEVPAEGIGVSLYHDKNAAREIKVLTQEITEKFGISNIYNTIEKSKLPAA